MPDLKLIIPQHRLTREAYQEFLLAKRSQAVAARTIEFYEMTAGAFAEWLLEHDASSPEQITAHQVRAFMVEVRGRGVSEATVRAHGIGAMAFCHFCMAEWGIPAFKVEMPKPAHGRMRLPSPEELAQLLEACPKPRDRALMLFLADTGARVSEAAALNWEDVDVETGMVRIRRGKGGKPRSVVIGVEARRALMRYRRTLRHEPTDPLWSGRKGRFSVEGIRCLFRRLQRDTGLRFSPHDMRRFFATGCLRGGMNALYVQALLGHEDLTMTRRYAQIVEDDLRQAHEQHGPVDRLLQGRREHGGNR